VRIVGGQWGSRRIESPPDARARPTTDRVREAWMAILGERLRGARVVDLFAGSGAMGLEALSRGAVRCDFVELSPASLAALGRNLEALGVDQAAARVHRADALRFAAKLEPLAFDVAFADPPYTTAHASRIAALFRERPFARILGVEHDVHEDVGPGEHRRYGRTVLTFLEAP
jgi:16S rRNA (guanine966-N2)-methyltransferase